MERLTYRNLKYLNSKNTIIQAETDVTNEDGSIITTHITIEPDNIELFNLLQSGIFGSIEPCDPVLVALENISEIDKYRKSLSCTRLQAKAILYQNGLLEQVDALISQSDFLVQLAWRDAQTIKRDSMLVNLLKNDIKWFDESPITDEDLDNLFEEAKLLEF